MAGLVDLSGWPEPERAVVARMVHATADESFAASARIGPAAVGAAVGALQRRAPVICDARMTAAGIPRVAETSDVTCYLDRITTRPPGRATRSEEAVELAAGEHPQGAVWVIGNAPTALARLLALHEAGRVQPAAVIGLPVGYVGAAEAKESLWRSPLAAVAVTNAGRRGGTPVAAAALNALHRLAYPPPR